MQVGCERGLAQCGTQALRDFDSITFICACRRSLTFVALRCSSRCASPWPRVRAPHPRRYSATRRVSLTAACTCPTSTAQAGTKADSINLMEQSLVAVADTRAHKL